MTNRTHRTAASFALAALIAVAPACAGNSSATKTSSAAPTPATLSEWKIDLGPTTLKAGKYQFKISNTGKAEHELIAFRTALAPADLPLKVDGNVNEEAAELTSATDGENIAAGASQTRTVDLSTPGTYVFMCNLPGHFKAGMSEVVTVTPA